MCVTLCVCVCVYKCVHKKRLSVDIEFLSSTDFHLTFEAGSEKL